MPVSGQQPSDGNGDRNRHGHSEHDLYGGLWTELGQGTRQTSAFIQQLRLLVRSAVCVPHSPVGLAPLQKQVQGGSACICLPIAVHDMRYE